MSWLYEPVPLPDVEQKFPKVTRVEVFGEDGRLVMKYNQKDVQLQVQDEGRTLKLWLRDGLDFSDGSL